MQCDNDQRAGHAAPHRQASCYAPEVSGTDSFPERCLPVQVIDRPVD